MALRCLILDHDDTVVDSTRAIHYPAYRRLISVLRPETPILSFEEWMLKNFDPGIISFFRDELGFDDREMELEYEMWRATVLETVPPLFAGMLDTLAEFRSRGGLITVVSHSEKDMITRAYDHASDGNLLPDAVYGWEQPPERRKPDPWPVLDILDRFGLEPDEALVVDDLKPGADMARAAGVSVAGAGWGYDIPRIRTMMQSCCDLYLGTVEEFAAHVLR